MFYLFGTNKRIGIVRKRNTSSSFCHLLCVSFVFGAHIIGVSACAPIKWADGISNSDVGNTTLFVFDTSEPSIEVPVSNSIVFTSGIDNKLVHENREDSVSFEAETIVQAVSTIDVVDTELSNANAESSSASFSSRIGLAVDKAASIAEDVYKEIVSLVSSEDVDYEPKDKMIVIKSGQEEPLDVAKKQIARKELVGKEDDSGYFAEKTSDHLDINNAIIDEINKLNELPATAAGAEIDSKDIHKTNDIVVSSLLAVGNFSDQVIKKSKGPNLKIQSVEPFTLSKENELSWQVVKADSSNKLCSLVSPTIQLESQDYTTQVWFEIVNESLQINTTTNLDSFQAELGIRFDNGPLLKFSSMPFANKVLWIGDLEGVIMDNSALRVYLGGNEFGTSIPELLISLSDLKRNYPKYSRCNSYQVTQSVM